MLRNFFKKKKTQQPEIELEEINLNEIQNWLNKKTDKLTEKEKEIFISIKEKTELSFLNIEEKIKVLEEIDIESKKVEGRAKIIVRQSLDKYLNFVKVFTKELTEIKKENLNFFIKKIDKTFSDFDKRSFIFYQRANYLIGDELLALKQEINNLSKYFTELFDKNKKTTQSFDIISATKSKLEQFNETNATLNEINIEIKDREEEEKENKKRKTAILDKIEKTKLSKEYLENIKRLDKIKLLEKELDNSTSKLKSIIDFKKLSNTFHSNQKKMKKIKSYKEDFQQNFERNKEDDLLELINEAKLDSNPISVQIKYINETKSKISKDKELIKKDELEDLLEEIRKIKLEIENITVEKIKHAKRKEKIKENKEEIIESITPAITKLGGNLSY